MARLKNALPGGSRLADCLTVGYLNINEAAVFVRVVQAGRLLKAADSC